jgi:O-antigen/teichoic acid export membrane protein
MFRSINPKLSVACGRALTAQFDSAALAAAGRKSLLQGFQESWRKHGDTLGTQVLTAGLGVMSGLLAPRLLGPAGRGELAAVALWPMTLTFLAMLGMDHAAAYFAAKGRPANSFGISTVTTTCLVVGLGQSLAVLTAGIFIIPAALRGYGAHAVRLGLLFLTGAPFILLGNPLAKLLLGHQDMRGYNLYRVIPPTIYSLAILILFLHKVPSVAAIVVFELAGFVLATVIVVRLVRRRLAPSWKWDAGIATHMLKYGAKTQAGGFSNFLNQRLDQLVMTMFLPSSQLGVYVAAVAFADGLWIIPRGIGYVTLADSANVEGNEAWRVTKRSLLLTGLCLVPSAVALGVLIPWLVTALFGARFAGAVLPCRILIPGSCALGLTTVLFEAARGMNRPEIPAYAEGASLLVTAALLAALLKPYGIAGAALASTIAYTVALGATWFLLVRRSPQTQRLNPNAATARLDRDEVGKR